MSTDTFWHWFWTLLVAVFVINIFFGDTIRDVFLGLIGRREATRLTRKEGRHLQQELDDARQTVEVANHLFRDIQAADKAFPQLPQDTRDGIDAFLEANLKRPKLPKKDRRGLDS